MASSEEEFLLTRGSRDRRRRVEQAGDSNHKMGLQLSWVARKDAKKGVDAAVDAKKDDGDDQAMGVATGRWRAVCTQHSVGEFGTSSPENYAGRRCLHLPLGHCGNHFKTHFA